MSLHYYKRNRSLHTYLKGKCDVELRFFDVTLTLQVGFIKTYPYTFMVYSSYKIFQSKCYYKCSIIRCFIYDKIFNLSKWISIFLPYFIVVLLSLLFFVYQYLGLVSQLPPVKEPVVCASKSLCGNVSSKMSLKSL